MFKEDLKAILGSQATSGARLHRLLELLCARLFTTRLQVSHLDDIYSSCSGAVRKLEKHKSREGINFQVQRYSAKVFMRGSANVHL